MHSFIVPEPPPILDSPSVLRIQPDATSIGITDIRAVQHFLSRRPTSSAPPTVIIHSAELMTLPAQHAFLKTLEEPPPGSQIFLVTTQPDLLLPTILSRCQINSGVEPRNPNQRFNPSLTPDNSDFLTKLLAAGVGDRLQLIDEAKFDRESALTFLNEIECFIHSVILSERSESKDLVHIANLVHDTRTYLKANCNVRLTLDHFVLKL